MNQKNISDRLISLRKAAGKTQLQVAEAIGISHKTLSKWELGASEPDLERLCALAEYYKVSTDFLLGRKDLDNSVADAVMHELSTHSKARGAQWLHALLRECPKVLASCPSSEEEPVRYPDRWAFCRSMISDSDLFFYQVTDRDENLSLLQLPNEGNFSRLLNEDLRVRISEYFAFLSDPDAILLCRTLHRADCSEAFTLDYISDLIALPPERTQTLLEEAVRHGLCSSTVAHCGRDEVTVYRSRRDGLLLAVLSLFCEIVEPHNVYDILQLGTCKIIREDRP